MALWGEPDGATCWWSAILEGKEREAMMKHERSNGIASLSPLCSAKSLTGGLDWPYSSPLSHCSSISTCHQTLSVVPPLVGRLRSTLFSYSNNQVTKQSWKERAVANNRLHTSASKSLHNNLQLGCCRCSCRPIDYTYVVGSPIITSI